MRKLLKRWYVWLALLLLLGLAVSVSMILAGASRINQESCDRIRIPGIVAFGEPQYNLGVPERNDPNR